MNATHDMELWTLVANASFVVKAVMALALAVADIRSDESARRLAAVRMFFRFLVREKFLAVGMELIGGTPADFQKVISDETVRMSRVIQAAKIRAE